LHRILELVRRREPGVVQTAQDRNHRVGRAGRGDGWVELAVALRLLDYTFDDVAEGREDALAQELYDLVFGLTFLEPFTYWLRRA
jgi:hypothetical protein